LGKVPQMDANYGQLKSRLEARKRYRKNKEQSLGGGLRVRTDHQTIKAQYGVV
jgi:hypothetical protein